MSEARIARRTPADTRRAILDAARRIAQQDGWPQVTMRRIATAADVSAMAAYRHFASREDLLIALLHEGFTALSDRLRAATEASEDPADALDALVEAYVGFAADQTDLYLVMYDLSGVHLDPTKTWQAGEAVGQVVADALGAVMGQPVGALDDVVLALWSQVHGLLALHFAGRLPGGLERVRVLASASVRRVADAKR